MNRFRYALDPLCLLACAGYVLNRWIVPHAWKGWFLQDYFNDVLFIPAAHDLDTPADYANYLNQEPDQRTKSSPEA